MVLRKTVFKNRLFFFAALALFLFTSVPSHSADTATLTIGGDLLLGGYYNSPEYGSMTLLDAKIDSLYKLGGAELTAKELFKNIYSDFYNADFAAANFEGPITPEYSIEDLETELIDKLFPCRQNHRAPEILQAIGIDIVSLANNHTFDYRRDFGLKYTMGRLDGKVEYVGAGMGAEAFEPVLKIKNDIKIAFFAVSDLLDPEDMHAREGVFGIAGIPEQEDYRRSQSVSILLEKLRTAETNNDFIMLMLHAGPIGGVETNERQESLIEILLESGVDIIAGCHSHAKQKIEEVRDDAGRLKQIAFYGLGNLVFGGRMGKQAESMIATVTMHKNPDGFKYLTYNTKYIYPNPDTTFTPVLVK